MKINKLIDKCIEDDVDIAKVHIDVLYEYAKDYNKLQQENKQLKKKYENAVADYELEKYKNNKAIEHIKKYQYWNGDNYNCLHCEELLEILGDKENE